MDNLLHNLDWVLPFRSPVATLIFTGFTWTVYAPFLLFFLPLGYWLWNKRISTRLMVFVLVSAILNSYLKDFFQDPRPDTIYRLDRWVSLSYGMPSGHAQTAVVVWFWLAYEIRRLWTFYFAAVMVLGVSLSRIYLGVHDVEDVLAGGLVGVLCLIFFRWYISSAFDFWRNLPVSIRIFITIAIEVVVFSLWPKELPSTALRSGGFLAGWFAGAVVESNYVGFRIKTRPFQRGLAGLIGMGTVFLIYLARRQLGSAEYSALIPYLSYFVAFLLGCTITLVIPILFRILGLAEVVVPLQRDLDNRSPGNDQVD